MAATFAHRAGPVADSAEATGVESKAASPGGGKSTAEPAERSPRYELPRPSAQPLDPSVALAVGRLVAAFGPVLGLDPDAIRLGLDHVPGRAAGAATVTGGHPLIELTVGAPDAVPDRALVVHELTHVAQHANRERGLAAPDTTAAEAEAGALAAAARHGTRLWIPLAALPAGRRAADADASGVSPAPSEPNAATMELELTNAVRTTRAGELRRINDALGSVWSTTGDAIETTLQVLETVDFVTARALLLTLPSESRIRLGHLDDADHRRHPLAAAAVIASLDGEIALLDRVEENNPDPLGTALHGLNVVGAAPALLRGVLATLRHVPEPVLMRLMRGDRRDAFRDLLATPEPPGTDADDLREAWQRETRAADLAGEDAARQIADELAARHLSGVALAHAALDALRPLAAAVPPEPAATSSAPAPPTTAQPPGGTAPADTTNAAPTPSERLRVAVTALDAVGMIDAILDNFPESERDSDATHYSQTLRTVLAARAPALTLPRIERLLWYGLFDWAITDSDALWAHFLVRTLPLADQDAWRVRDDGTWFGRLEANLPDAFRVSSAYSGVGSEFTGGLPSGRPADPDIVDMLLTRIWGHWGANHDATSAIWVTRTLLGLDPAELTWPAPDPPSVEVRTQAVRRFDAGGDLDDLYNSFPDNYIYNQPGRGELLDLNAMRDPVHLAMRASALLSTGLSDWWVSSREAWIAYQLVRALSPEQQERFQQEHANEWSSMMSAMTPEMRASTASTPLSGRGPRPSREQLRERLRDDRLWNPEHADQLRALIDILRAADDGAFVFEESSRHTNPKLGQLFADLRLYGAGIPPRTTYQAEEIRGRAVGVDVLDFAGMGIRGALVLIGSLFVVDIFNRTINATGYNLDWLQWAMGGDLEGARLAERPSGPPPGGTRAAAAAAMGDHEGWPGEDLQANRLSFQTDLQNGIVHLTLPELLLDSVNFVRAGSAYRTGRVRLVDLIVTASFSDRHYRNPVGVEATAMEVGIDDMVVANPSVGALALAHLFLSALAFNSRALGNEDLDEVQLERGLTPIWILGPLLELLANVVAIRGTVPFGPSLVDLALMPVTAGMPMWQSTPIGWVANALVPSPHPVDYAWGLFSDGTLRPPRTVSERAADAMRLLRSVDLHFGELTIEGLSLGSGIETASLTIRDLDIGAARSRPAYLRQLISSLDLAWARADPAAQAAIQQRRDEALAELYGTPEHPGGLAALETELEGLERRDRWIAGSLSDAESKRMAELSDLLRRDTGVVIDIGSIEVGEVTGRVQTAGARISNIHFDGHVPIDTGGAYYSDEELAARFLGRTQAPPATTPADAYLTIASAELLRGPKGSPILRIAADSVPTAEAVQDRLKAMPPGANPELRARLEDVLPLLGELEQLRSPGHEPTPDEQKHITALTNTIRDRIGITVGSLSLGPISGGLDESGALTATVHGIDVQDVVVDGYSVRRVTGDLDLGVPGVARLAEESPALGAAATSERARGLAAHLGIDATIEQAESETGDVLERGTLDISGDVRATPDGLALSNVWLGRLALEAVTIGAPEADLYLHGDRVTAEGISADAEVHFADTGGERHFASAVITNLRIDRLSGGNLVYESTDTHAGRRLHVEAPSGALGGVVIQNVTIARDSAAGLAIDASATAGGLEVVGYTAIRTTLSDGSTKTVTGTLRGGAMPDVRTAPPPPPGTSPTAAEPVAGSPSGGPAPVLSASYVSDASGSTISLGPHDLDALGTEIVIGPGRSIVIRQARVSTAPGASTGIELTDQATRFAVTFGNVKLGAVRWESGEMLVTSDAGTTATSAIATGRLQSGDPNAKDPAERNDYLQIDDLDIHELDAPQLTFYWPPFQIDLGRTHAHQGALRAVRVHLLGFRLPFAADGSPGSPTAGHLEVTGTHVDLRALIADGLAARVTSPDDIRASGELDVDAITVDIEGANHYVAHISGASAVADADTAAWALHAGLPDVEGTIEYTPEAVVIRDMRLGNAALDSLRLSTTVKNHLLNLTIDSGGGVYFTDIRGNARVNLWKKGESHPADAWCRSLAIDSLEIYRIDAEGLRLELPDDGVVITAPPMLSLGSAPLAPLVTLRHIVIAEPGGPSFEWQPGKAGFMRGTPRIDEITAPLVAEVAGKFHGVLELDTGETTIGLLERGEFTVDVANPRARMNDPAWLDTPDRGIFVEELGAESLHYGEGALDVHGTHIEHLRFDQPGVVIDVRRIGLPGAVTVVPATGTGTIPELQIDDAHIHLDFAAMGGGAAGARPIDQASLESLLDHLQGGAFMNAEVLVTPPWPWKPYIASLPLAATVTNGRVATPHGGQDEAWFQVDRDHDDLVFSFHVPYIHTPVPLHRISLLPPPTPASPPAAAPPTAPAPSAPVSASTLVDTRTFTLSNIAIDLSARSFLPIPVTLVGDPSGTITLMPNALIDFFAQGSLRPTAGVLPRSAGWLKMSMSELNIDSSDFVYMGVGVMTGRIEIRHMTGGSIVFDGTTPTTLDATIKSAVAHDIGWTLHP